MKRYISIIMIFCMLLTPTLTSAVVFADAEIDKTAPSINALKFVDSDNINSELDQINIEFELIEDGTGLCSLDLSFGEETFYWSDNYEEDDDVAVTNPILFTGVHKLSYTFFDKLAVGTHKLTGVRGEDVNGNVFYMGETAMEEQWGSVPTITVTKSSHVNFVPEYKINQLEVLQSTNLDASKSIPIKISFDVNFNVRSIRLDLSRLDHSGGMEHLEYVSSTPLKSGTYTISVPIEEKLVKGTYRLYGVTFNNQYFVDIETESEPEIHIVKSKVVKKSIDLNTFSIRENELNTPALLKIDLDVETNNNEFNYICLSYEEENGKYTEFYGEVEKISEHAYTAEIPIGTFVGEGNLRLRYITLSDKKYEDATVYTSYNVSKYPELLKDGDITLDSGYNITYFSSLGNSSVIGTLERMNPGETAVLDCRHHKTAPKELFTAIAGRDVTVAFVDYNVQWVFNGKDIKKSKCKKINLKSSIQVVSGSSAGFPDDTKVAKLIFKDNGELPGEVEMRINYDYLASKYKFKKENLKLTYLAPYNPVLEDSNVDMAKDQYYEYEVDHNSTFVLSKNKAQLGATKVTLVPNNLKNIKIKWEKKSGNGYYIYRATKKDGTYKKIATIKKNTTISYVDKDASADKTYYYKVKPYSNKKSFNKTAKMSEPCKAYTKLKTPRICSAVYSKKKKGIRIEWTWISGALKYELYRSTKENGKYRKITTLSKTFVWDKTAKQGNTYYYKVKAIYKSGSKHNSNYSKVKSTL